MPDRRLLVSAAPLALAIGVFGVVFGAAASPQLGALTTLAMSLFIFSGTIQFAAAGLLASGAGIGALLLTVVALNARNLVLGAALRSHVSGSRPRRALMSWFLLDESFGLAVASPGEAARVLVVSGALLWTTWQLGTLLGVAGAQAVALEDIATAVFPVLFIGLAAITARRSDLVLRAALAGAIVAGLTVVIPSAHPFLPIAAALAVALPSRSRS